MKNNILLVGAGQLGSRYLQGLVKISFPLNIYVIDPNINALNESRKRCSEISFNEKHNIYYYDSLSLAPKNLSLAIIATSADVRLNIVTQLIEDFNIDYWILEKFLVQSLSQLDKLQELLTQRKVWVNTPRRLMNIYKEINEFLEGKNMKKYSVRGGSWGMACNSIHYLDLLFWLSKSATLIIDNIDFNSKWVPAKRIGFYEIYGRFSGRSICPSGLIEFDFECNQSIQPLIISIESSKGVIKICESDETVTIDEVIFPQKRIPYQSEFTDQVVSKILETGSSELPCLHDSALIHGIMLKVFKQHWDAVMPGLNETLPIT
jgi:hypothetical protein